MICMFMPNVRLEATVLINQPQQSLPEVTCWRRQVNKSKTQSYKLPSISKIFMASKRCDSIYNYETVYAVAIFRLHQQPFSGKVGRSSVVFQPQL